MTAPALMLAHRADDLDALIGWWSTEKLDGVRAYWDGQRLVTRRGFTIAAPKWYTDALPSLPLDGELWLGRGRFDETSGVVRRKMPRVGGAEWQGMAFVVFDAPTVAGGFEDRIAAAKAALAAAPSKHAFVIPMVPITSADQVRAILLDVESKGGEGLVARKPGSPYVATRSHDMLKIKSLQDDEAVVLTHYLGDAGKPGVTAMWRGVEIKIVNGFLADGSNRPPVGALVTFGYFERTKDGKPRFPIFLRERNDP